MPLWVLYLLQSIGALLLVVLGIVGFLFALLAITWISNVIMGPIEKWFERFRPFQTFAWIIAMFVVFGSMILSAGNEYHPHPTTTTWAFAGILCFLVSPIVIVPIVWIICCFSGRYGDEPLFEPKKPKSKNLPPTIKDQLDAAFESQSEIARA